MRLIGIVSVIIVLISFQSCGDEAEKSSLKIDAADSKLDSLDKSSLRTVDSIKPVKNDRSVSPKFKLKVDSHAEEFDPNTTIYLENGADQIEVAAISGEGNLIGREEFSDMDIPKQAIQACGAWWAGAGEYFYVIRNASGDLEVYRGWLDEYQTKKDYHWKKIDLNLH